MKEVKPEKLFAICVRNDNYDVSLEKRKIYQIIPDPEAAEQSMIRVIDESGDDYLYPADYFVPVDLPESTRQALLKAA